jgi:3'-phosphoadenosine 5'-phosphosulfate sulfotransferase (PAPS reductase)/FAD synthetase
MGDPFKIEGPALISFSGGRTSGYMLWRILQAHGGTLPDDVKVTFANTGKEMPQTLDFVRDCGERWGVEIVWLEYRWVDGHHTFERVTYETAARAGEPFARVIEARSMLPNPIARFCTQDLKIRTMKRYAQSLGWDAWDNVVGLRADEMRRVRNLHDNNRERGGVQTPLATAGITKAEVSAFWEMQNFDLRLLNVNGRTPLGNCDLCFLKPAASIVGMIRDNPDLATWWIAQEEGAIRTRGHRYKSVDLVAFRKDRPGYAEMLKATREQTNMDFGDRDELIDCFCGDAA